MKNTVYEINYTNRLNEMLDLVIRKYGFEAKATIYFATLCDKYATQANYINRKIMEKVFAGLMRK